MSNSVLPTMQGDPSAQGPEFLRMPSVLTRTGLGRSTIYRLVSENKFPAPVKLAGRAVGWRRADLDRWSATRPSTPH